MKRTPSALMLILVLFVLLVAGVQTVKAPYTSDGQAFPLATALVINSPSNITYSNGELALIVNCRFLLGPRYMNLSYSIDGLDKVTIPVTGTQEPREGTRTYANGTSVKVNSTFLAPYDITGEVALPELSEGEHNITVYAKYLANQIVALDESTIYFTINTNSEQEIPEFPSWTIIPLVLIVTFALLLFKKRLSKRKSGNYL